MGTIAVYLGFAFHTVHLGVRWWESYQMGQDIGHIPVSNLFESMSFGAWTIMLMYMVVEKKYNNRSFGVFVTPVALLAMAYIGFAPNVGKEIEPLVPALQSYWLHIHVITSFLGYAAFAISFGVSLMYLIVTTKEKDAIYTFWTMCIGMVIALAVALGLDGLFLSQAGGKHILEASFRSGKPIVQILSFAGLAAILGLSWAFGTGIKDRLATFANTSEMLDEVGYKTIAVGFPLLTLGIITGAVWANEAWGTYWGWDPKETWSLITWLFYAAYLHARYTRGWRGSRAAILSIVGFLAVVFTYLGVNLLLSGLHSYGASG
jgi:cytochrome c-type biogenesis protein CcsB